MRQLSATLGISLIRKIALSLTGLLLFGFVATHLSGNLLLFVGADDFNLYAHKLEEMGILLIFSEIGLLSIFLVHVVTAVSLTWNNYNSRGLAYQVSGDAGGASRKTLSSKYMIYTGIAIAVFIFFHVWMFKYGPGAENPDYRTVIDGVEMRDLHKLVAGRFSEPLVAFSYVGAMLFLGLHLRHGFWSGFQSLGLSGKRITPVLYFAGLIVAIVFPGGFLIMPLWFFFNGGSA